MKINSQEIYKKWLNSEKITNFEKQALLSYTKKEIKNNFKQLAFGTSGIREIAELGTSKINRFTVRSIALSYSKFLKQQSNNPTVAIFRDNRKNSEEFVLEAASILAEEGIEIYVSPGNIPSPTPFLSYLIKKLNLTGGINITASHNPIEYNGIKLYNSLGQQLSKKQEKDILKNLKNPSEIINIPPKPSPKLKEINPDLINVYFEEIKKSTPSIGQDKSTKILFSSHHGATSKIMKLLANKMGFFNFIEYGEECNITWQLNAGETINPEDPNSFNGSIKKAEELKISYVLASDPDGDRCAIAEKQKDNTWYFFNGSEIGMISAHFRHQWQTIKKPYIVISKTTGNLFKKIFPDIPLHLTSVGFKNISQKIEQEESKGNNLLIGFEESIGSLLIPIHREKDSFQQTALALEIISHLQRQNLTIKEYLENIYKKFGYWKSFTDYYMVSRSSIKKIKNLNIEEITSKEYDRKSKIITWNLEQNNWIKFRYSGTEPKLKIYYNLFKKDKLQMDLTVKKFKELFDDLFLKNE